MLFKKSVQREERKRDERATENERVRKRLKRKRGESGVEEKRTKEKCDTAVGRERRDYHAPR